MKDRDRTKIGMKSKVKESQRKEAGKQWDGMGFTREWKGFPSPLIPSPSKAKELNGMERRFEGIPLELLGKIHFLNNAFICLFQGKIGRNLIDSHYFCLKKRTIHLSSCLLTQEKDN